MYTYEEIYNKIYEAAGGHAKYMDTYLYTQVATADPDKFAESLMRLIGFGYQIAMIEMGRNISEESGFEVSEAERKLIMQDFHRHSINAISMTYTILVQIPLAEAVPFIQKSVEHIFDIGYKIAKMNLPRDSELDEEEAESALTQDTQEFGFDFSDDDLGFLSGISDLFEKGEDE